MNPCMRATAGETRRARSSTLVSSLPAANTEGRGSRPALTKAPPSRVGRARDLARERVFEDAPRLEVRNERMCWAALEAST